MKRLKVLFFIPHPDDLEFGAALFCIEALNAGMDVVQVLMTNGEYGTHRKEFRGKTLREIRRHELERTLDVYKKATGNELRLIRMNYIDGHLPVNKSSLNNIIQVFRTERPDIIFAPDPFFPVDFHPDHLKTGKLPCLALNNIEKESLPKKVFLFYSYRNNRTIKTPIKLLKILNRALAQHRSQVPPNRRKLYIGIRKLTLIVRILIYGSAASRVREIMIKPGKIDFDNKLSKPWDLLKYYFFTKITDFGPKVDQYIPSPKELGLIDN